MLKIVKIWEFCIYISYCILSIIVNSEYLKENLCQKYLVVPDISPVLKLDAFLRNLIYVCLKPDKIFNTS